MAKISVIAGKRFITLSPHATRFWTGEVVEGDKDFAAYTTLVDKSETIGVNGEFTMVKFDKKLTSDATLALTEVINNPGVDYILTPAIFSSVDLSALPKKGKMVAFIATDETARSAPQDKVASSRLSVIW